MSKLRGFDGKPLKPQLEMIRLNDPIPVLPDMAQGYAVRPINIDDLNSYTETFSTAFDETPPFGELVQNSLPKGFLCVEYLPTGTVVASASAAIYKISQHPTGHSLQWVVAHSEHRGKGIGHAVISATTEVLSNYAPDYSYLSTDDFRLPAISIYLKLGWQPLLFDQDQKTRWQQIFSILKKTFCESDWPKVPPIMRDK